MENNNKKSFVASEVIRRTGFCPDNIAAIKAAGVTEIVVNAMGRIVVTWGTKLVMWDAPTTPAGKVAAQRAILAAGLKLTGAGVLPAALPKQPAPARVVTREDWKAARDAKEAEEASRLLDLQNQPEEEAKEEAPKPAEEAKEEKKEKVRREPKTRGKKAE